MDLIIIGIGIIVVIWGAAVIALPLMVWSLARNVKRIIETVVPWRTAEQAVQKAREEVAAHNLKCLGCEDSIDPIWKNRGSGYCPACWEEREIRKANEEFSDGS